MANLYCLNAQQVYRSEHFGTPGFEILYGVSDTNGFHESMQQGEDVTWDFSNLVAQDFRSARSIYLDEALDLMLTWTVCPINTHTLYYSGFQCIPILADVSHAIAFEDSIKIGALSGVFTDRFLKKTTDNLIEIFFLTRMQHIEYAKTGIVYTPSDTILSFPLAYGSEFSSRTQWSIDLNYFDIDMKSITHFQRNSTVDSWGTLITPYDTLRDVLRLRRETIRMDTVVGLGATIFSQREVEYSWYDTLYGLPVMIARGTIHDSVETISQILFSVEIACQPLEVSISADTSIFYLDSLGKVTVHFSVDSSNADFYNWTFGDGSGIHQSNGDTSHVFRDARTFYISVQGCLSDCLPLNTCAYKYLQIKIIDTFATTALMNLDQSDFKVYPNPTTGELSVKLSNDNNQIDYVIQDIYGRRVLSGNFNSDQQSLDLSELVDGLYFLLMQDNSNKVINQTIVLLK